MNTKFVSLEEAIEQVKDNDTVATSGFVQVANPEALEWALGKRFEETNSPKDLTLFYCAGQGDGNNRAVNHFAKEGLLKRVIAGHMNSAPILSDFIMKNKCEAYNIPQGILCAMVRNVAAKKVGVISSVGLHTFADPRIEGCKSNSITTEDVVELINIAGREQLFYKAINLDVAFIKGSYADTRGNISMEKEGVPTEATSIAQAVHNNGGTVIVQVDNIVKAGSLDPKLVKIPGIYVDYVVEVEDKNLKQQCYGVDYEEELAGKTSLSGGALNVKASLNERKIIARRGTMEIEKGNVGNLGIGVPEMVSSVVSEEGISDWMTLTVESGPVGGSPQAKNRFGTSINADAILDQPYQFDFYDGGGLDITFLGLAEADRFGNLNVSKFGGRVAGCGGFIDISQNAKKVVFCGSFTAGGLKVEVRDGELKILNEGKFKKFVKDVEQITFSGEYARLTNQEVYYITERAVFKMMPEGITLIEIAPGIDLKKDVLNQMEFTPLISKNLKLMDKRIFKDEVMNLKFDK